MKWVVREGFMEELTLQLSLKDAVGLVRQPRMSWGRGKHEQGNRGVNADGVLVIGWETSPTREMAAPGWCCKGGRVSPVFGETGWL